MALKYAQLDVALTNWLSQNQEGVTTAMATEALNITCPTAKRHISRRFSQLEDRGTLVCELEGTTRVCKVITRLPMLLSKQRVFVGQVVLNSQAIPASNSEEFVARGGVIEKLPAAWNDPERCAIHGSLPLGEAAAGIRQYRADLED